MPITQSAKKALRQSIRRKAQNLARKDAYKKAIKEFRKFVASKEIEKAKALLSRVFQTLDKATKTNALPKNTARRLKSRLSKLVRA